MPFTCITTKVPYHRPIPENKRPDKDGSNASGSVGGGIISSWVQAEKMVQIAMMLPSAGFLGWLAGYGLDRWLHQTWMSVAGAMFGIVAGLVGAVRMAMFYGNKSAADSGGDNSGKNGNPANGESKTGDPGKAQ
jgi:ATP synthase protein I